MNVIYLSYDGMTDPLGQSQVIPYVKGLSQKGHKMTIVSFEKTDRLAKYKTEIEKELKDYDIIWYPFIYKRGLFLISTLINLIVAAFFLKKYIKENHVEMLHCRSYISSILGLYFKNTLGTKFIFDMRGFWADERKEAGMLNNSLLYGLFKKLERNFIIKSDAIISLTQKAIEEMKTWNYVEESSHSKFYHISTCCNLHEYSKARESNMVELPNDKLNLIYIGSIGPWHSIDDIKMFIKTVYYHCPNSHFTLILNQGSDTLYDFISIENMEHSRFTIESLSHKDIPGALANKHIGFFFIPPTFAKMASSPTKMGEMLAAGLPIITGHSIGDVDMLVRDNNIGYIVNDNSPEEYRSAVDYVTKLISNNKQVLAARCNKVATNYFSMSKAIESYNGIYNNLTNKT